MFSTNLGLGSTGADVVALQTWLISNGYNIPAIASGQQAKGYFGIQTQSALMRYQMANGLNVSGVGYDKELGFFGPLTRAKVNSSCTTTSTGGIVASLDPSSPQTSTVQISSTSITPNIPLAVFDLKSQGAPSTLQSLKVGMPTMSPNLKGSQPGTLFTNIFIKAGGQSYAETSMVGDTITFSNISIPLPADVSVPIAVYVSVAQNTNNFYDGSNVSVNLPLNGIVALDSNYNNVPVNQGPIVGLLSGSTITFTSNSVQVSNTSAVLGTGITETINGPIIAYPVSF
jgi:peptidoglycan hydrolase-like protein with peptidoglycan-binding domain